MKIIARILIVLVLLVLIPVFWGNSWVSRYAVREIEKATGFSASFDDLHVGFFKPVVRIDNLVLTNPPDFPHPEMFAIRELYVRYDPLSLFGQNVRLHEVRVDVPRVVLVQPEQGESNIEALTRSGRAKGLPGDAPAPPKPETRPEPPTAAKAAPKPERAITIGNLRVKLGEMEVRQYRARRDEPVVMTVPVGLDRSFQNVTNLQEVGQQLAGELLVRSTVGVLGNLDTLLPAIINEDGKLDPAIQNQLKELRNMFRQK